VISAWLIEGVAASREFMRKTRSSKRKHGLQAGRLRVLLPEGATQGSKPAIHRSRDQRSALRLQSNWGAYGTVVLRVLRLWAARCRQRAALRAVTNDPHLLKDIGVISAGRPLHGGATAADTMVAAGGI